MTLLARTRINFGKYVSNHILYGGKYIVVSKFVYILILLRTLHCIHSDLPTVTNRRNQSLTKSDILEALYKRWPESVSHDYWEAGE